MSSPDYTNDDRFDGLFLQIAHQTQGIEPLLDTLFSFLRRKSDFFSPPGGENVEKGSEAAIAKVNEVVKKHADIYLQGKRKEEEERLKKLRLKQKREAEAESKKKQQAAAKKSGEEEGVIELGDDGFDISGDAPSSSKPAVKKEAAAVVPEPKSDAQPPPAAKTEQKNKNDGKDGKQEEEEEEEEDNSPPPIGNGGTVDGKYVWTQTLQELTINVPLPENTRGRDLNVVVSKKHLKIGFVKTKKEFLIDDDLTKPIIVDDSLWTIEDGNRLVLTLQKCNQME